MKTVRIEVPMDLVVPIGYEIQVKLDGDKSHLCVKETFPTDIPEGMMDRTVSLAKELYSSLFGGSKVKIEKLSDYETRLEIEGSEEDIVSVIVGEFATLRKAYFPKLALSLPKVTPMV